MGARIKRVLLLTLFEFVETIRYGGALFARSTKQWEEEYQRRRKEFLKRINQR